MALDRSVVTIAAPTLQARYDLTLPQLGIVFSVFSWAYALMQIPAGALVSRFGPRITMMIAIVLWSAMTAVTPFAGSFAYLLVVRALLAIGQSPDWPGSMVSIDRLFPTAGRAVANGVLMCSLYAGIVLGAPLASHLLMAIGLKGMFLFCGAMGIAFAAVWWVSFRLPSDQIYEGAKRQSLLFLRKAAGSGRVWTLAAAYACTAALLNFYLPLFPTYLAKARGMGLERMGNYAAISSSALCPAALIAGPVLAFAFRRTSSVKAARLPFAIGSLAIVAIISLIIPWLTSDLAILSAATVSLAAIGFAQVTTWCAVQDIGGTDTATLTGFTALAGNLAAGVMPIVAALLVTFSGAWNSSFHLLAAVAGIGCLLWLFIDPSRPLNMRHCSPASLPLA
jgi:ACS family glucarate transporter-like MFS transporter